MSQETIIGFVRQISSSVCTISLELYESYRFINAGERIRTSEPTKRRDFESRAFDHFATPAYDNKPE